MFIEHLSFARHYSGHWLVWVAQVCLSPSTQGNLTFLHWEHKLGTTILTKCAHHIPQSEKNLFSSDKPQLCQPLFLYPNPLSLSCWLHSKNKNKTNKKQTKEPTGNLLILSKVNSSSTCLKSSFLSSYTQSFGCGSTSTDSTILSITQTRSILDSNLSCKL